MANTASPTREFQHRRRLSVDAEDELFKSLQGIQELNNNSSRGTNRRSIDVARTASPGNLSGRKGRRSIDVTRAASPGNHSSRMRRSIPVDVTRAPSPGNHSSRMRRSIPVDVTRAASPGNHSGRMSRRSIDVTRSPGTLARRQRRASLTNGRKSVNSSNLSPRRNNSGRRKVRSQTPPRDAFFDSPTDTGTTPQPLSLNRQTSGGGGAVRSPMRNRRASTGTEVVPVATKGRTARRSESAIAPESPKGRTKQRPTAGVSPVRRLGLHRANTTPSDNSSPASPKRNVYPATHSPTRSPTRSQDWSEMTMRANLLKDAKAPTLDNSTTSWASFDESIVGSDIEEPTSDRSGSTKSTKPTSERTAQSSSSDRPAESSDLSNLLLKLRDPAEMEKWKAQKEQMTSRAPSLQHEKVAEKASSRNLKNFLQRSKRGYGQQANLDGLSVVQ